VATAAPLAMVQLKTVEIPGLADCLRNERRLRDEGFLEGMPEEVLGIPVAALTLRHWHWLAMLRNGHVVACRFDDLAEAAEHAIQVLWVLTPGLPLPSAARPYNRALRWRVALAKARAALLTLRHDPAKLVAAVRAHIDEAFFDTPFRGDGANEFARSFPSSAASIIDLLAAAGYPWSRDEVLDTPLKILWQQCRAAVKRLNPDAPAPNPSDLLRVEAVARLNSQPKS